jgi:imidazolonepropionase-like amidohydrolase
MKTNNRTQFRNGYLWDGKSDQRVQMDVLVEGDRIAAIGAPGSLNAADALTIDARGATLIPGMIDAHGHLSFPESTSATAIEDTPPEEMAFLTMHNAKRMIDAGFTGVIGAGSPKLRSEVVVRNEIDAGRVPGPRLMASTPTLTATGGLNDSGQLHQQRDIAAMVVDGTEEVRKAVRLCYREGVDVVKLNISGDDFFPRPSGRVTTMAEDEVRMACDTARELGLMVVAHARSATSVKYAVRAGVTIIHHADFCDEEAMDMLEEAKDRVFVTPTVGFYHGLLRSGFPEPLLERMMVRPTMETNIATHRALKKRGLRMLIGGDYGVAFMPNGTNAADIAHLVNYIGLSPVEALRAATYYGGLAMGLGSGHIAEGKLADLVLVEGDPTADPALAADGSKLRVIMKGGVLHKSVERVAEGLADAA